MMKITYLIAAFLMLGFFQAQEMHTNFDEAQKQAQNEGKRLVLVFTGSDWCVPCMKLHNNILSTEEFQTEMQEGYVLINADLPQKKKNKEMQDAKLRSQNKHLADKYNPEGYFPFVVIFDTDMNVVGNLTYEEISPEEYAKKIFEFTN